MAQSATPPGQLMPAAFFGHGNPMNALEVNRYTAAWRASGQAVPRPRAILVISAHCCINAGHGRVAGLVRGMTGGTRPPGISPG